MTIQLRRPATKQHNKPLIGSRDAAEALCTRLNQTMDQLIDSIDEETQLVRSGKLLAASEVQPNKSELAKSYISDIAQVKENALALSRLAPTSIDALRTRHEEFRAMLKINLAVLATAREVSQDIIHTVKMKTSSGPGTTTYGRSGAMAEQKIIGERGIAVDQSL